LRLSFVHGLPLRHIPNEESESFDGEREVFLLTRVFSLLPATLRDVPWEGSYARTVAYCCHSKVSVTSTVLCLCVGPLDHDLLGFNSLAKAMHRALRNVLEAELAARVLRRECTALPAGCSIDLRSLCDSPLRFDVR
jgi:hypothetical protein